MRRAHSRGGQGNRAFPAKARIPLRLLVEVPKKDRERPFQVYVRQHHESEEIGRVTWRLMKRRKER